MTSSEVGEGTYKEKSRESKDLGISLLESREQRTSKK